MSRFILSFLVFLVVCLAGVSGKTAFAQTSTQTQGQAPSQSQNGVSAAPGIAEQAEVDLASWTGILDNISQGLRREGLAADQLDSFFAEAQRIQNLATQEISKLEPRLNELSQQLKELGEAPAEGAPPETPEVQQRRNTLNEEFGRIDADVKASRLAVVRSQQIQRTITQERQNRFFSSISVRNNAVSTSSFWGKFIGGFQVYTRSLSLLFSDSISIMFGEFKKKPWKIFALLFFTLGFILIFIRLRRFLSPAMEEDALDGYSSFYNSRFARFCRQGVLPVVFIYAVYQLFDVLFLLTERFYDFLSVVLFPVSFFIIALVLLRIILSPNANGERTSKLSDATASYILRIATVGLGAGLLITIVSSTSRLFVSPVEITIGLSLLFSIVIAAMVIAGLWAIRKDKQKRSEIIEQTKTTRLFTYLTIVTWAVAIFIILSSFTGYIALGEFLSQQLLFGLVVIGISWLLLRSIESMFAVAAPSLIVQGAQLPGDEDASASQFAILGSGILKLIVYLAGGILLMLPWGYRTTDFYQFFKNIFFGFEIGGLSISISTVLLALGLFFLGYTITVALRNWLNNKLLPTTKLDIGISNSISTVFGYIGFILAAILGVSAAGFDLSNLAIVAGALSVCVGFGLQSIVNNFVSGLILLAERPIKAGDWIVTSGGEGTVKKISVRSTEIETFDRATVIVPNSTLITDNVTNWTHENKTGRIIIPVGVGYDSDPVQVQEILLECAKAHKLVLGRPAPNVFFMDFGASSLDFQLRCFLADINNSLTVSSELRFAILSALREANIEIPFPQNDVHIRSDETK